MVRSDRTHSVRGSYHPATHRGGEASGSFTPLPDSWVPRRRMALLKIINASGQRIYEEERRLCIRRRENRGRGRDGRHAHANRTHTKRDTPGPLKRGGGYK